MQRWNKDRRIMGSKWTACMHWKKGHNAHHLREVCKQIICKEHAYNIWRGACMHADAQTKSKRMRAHGMYVDRLCILSIPEHTPPQAIYRFIKNWNESVYTHTFDTGAYAATSNLSIHQKLKRKCAHKDNYAQSCRNIRQPSLEAVQLDPKKEQWVHKTVLETMCTHTHTRIQSDSIRHLHALAQTCTAQGPCPLIKKM